MLTGIDELKKRNAFATQMSFPCIVLNWTVDNNPMFQYWELGGKKSNPEGTVEGFVP
jgi:hypothetical protein